MQLHLRDLKPEMVEAWRAVFKGYPEVTISQGGIFASGVPNADAIVSPANSYGFMDGGIDLVYSEYLGWDVQDRLRALLRKEHGGILPVGQAIIVPTAAQTPESGGDVFDPDVPAEVKAEACSRFKYLISAPTMTVPMSVVGTINAFLAMRAVFLAALEHNQRILDQDFGHEVPDTYIESILCPGLGTAVGMMPPNVAAVQMLEAYKACILKTAPHFNDLPDAWGYHDRLRRGLT